MNDLFAPNAADIPKGPQPLAERLRQRVRSQSFEMGERLTASFGVGVLNDGETLDLLLCRVDDALYRAKQRRDCVACC